MLWDVFRYDAFRRCAACQSKGKIPGCLFLDGSQALHQSALAACSVVFVNYTFFRSLIQHTDGFQDGCFGVFGAFACEGLAGVAHGDAGTAAKDAVAQAALFVLRVAFDLGFDVSQGSSSKGTYRILQRLILHERGRFVQPDFYAVGQLIELPTKPCCQQLLSGHDRMQGLARHRDRRYNSL